MDPTTTLFTFMLKTHPSIQAVHLVGSWDNFGRAYTMERDIRRDRGQWRGCYSFKDIICDGDSGSVPKRNGGLKMGTTYYYYYELDGANETHDATLPSTNTCPYLPGQTVNTLWVPVEQPSRQRSASLNSLCDDDWKTMNPSDKFITPRAAPTPPTGFRRIGTAPQLALHKRSARSMSPGSGWAFSPRKLFSRKASSSSLVADAEAASTWEDERSVRSSEGSRSRDISPDSLRRFLSDDTLATEEPESSDWPSIAIPEDIVEENEDDDNFATSAVSESLQYTALSPPPTQRCFSPSISSTVGDAQTAPTEPDRPAPAPPTRSPPEVPQLEAAAPVPQPQPQSRFSFSDASFYSQNSPQSPDSHSLPSFYHSEDEDDELFITNDEEAITLPGIESTVNARSSFVRDLDAALSTYSLPQLSTPDAAGKLSVVTQPPVGSPALVARDGTDVPVGNTTLLTSPIPNSGLEELVNELGWMADVIRGKEA
ncbi:hypothetical protein B0T16DRAFT_413377 [Cercophora newfieldiana]|uniref:Uncharacterized protein n=1 Tax=Cercophora newfieldiana TaxID=92897 RepID=A0AA40CRE9_9PEZI|nr:hypothetical protein B0T16DRAFT_413377 [Cercophora newfieldiana]